jgi:hypothetical protein
VVHARVLRFLLQHGTVAHAAVIEAADLDALRRAGVVAGRGLLVDGLNGAAQALHLRAPRLVRPRETCVPSDWGEILRKVEFGTRNETRTRTIEETKQKREREEENVRAAPYR